MRDFGEGRRLSDGNAPMQTSGRVARLGATARTAASIFLALSLLLVTGPVGAAAGERPKPAPKKGAAYVPETLVEQADAAPQEIFNVIVQGDRGEPAGAVARRVAAVAAKTDPNLSQNAPQADLDAKSRKILRTQVTGRLSPIDGISARLTGEQIRALVDGGEGLSITPDAPVEVSASPWSSKQLWVEASGVKKNWDVDSTLVANMPAIAIVDSGVQSRSDFAGRVVASVDLTSLPNNTVGDGRGHGTFVAGIAAGAGREFAGASPAAEIVSIDVMDDTGMGLTSDVIRACQWILAHADEYDIRVANFSLQSTNALPFHRDPLNRAIEQLWFEGIVVVVAAGNYGSADGPSGVLYSPANDPFVITVGAVDVGKDPTLDDDTPAPWSAWGSTLDGFAKPELSAPGRYIVGPVPQESTLVSERREYVTGPGYMQLSGTSFAAAVVSGVAASLLARQPGLTPDEVKGALMLTALPLKNLRNDSMGVGELAADQAVLVKNAPNPNQALNRYVRALPDGSGIAFDASAWHSPAASNASWTSASWNSASWNTASWNSASWNSVSWNSASWNSASWNSASWNSASWNSASWNSVSWDSASWNSASWNSASWASSLDGAADDPPPGIKGARG